MKNIVTILFSALSISTSIALASPDDKEKKKKAKSSCCSYDEFARKNKRVKTICPNPQVTPKTISR
jgi:hypothetical protein